MVRMLALFAALSLASPAAAQAHGVTTTTLDVVGPRSTRAVRSTLRAHGGDLERCRGEADALVRVSFAIAPDGSVLSPTGEEDPDLDRFATECATSALAGLRFPGRATGTTTVSWSFRLVARPLRRCFCFDWIHGPDHGHTCEPTRARCEAEHASFARERTACRASEEPSCEHDAWIGGQHLRQEP